MKAFKSAYLTTSMIGSPHDIDFICQMMTPRSRRKCSWYFLSSLLFDLALSTGKFHYKMYDRGVSSSPPFKTMSSIEKNLLVSSSHQMIFTAITAALTVTTPAVSKASVESEYLERFLQNSDTGICIFSPGYKIELEQYRNIAYGAYPYTRSSIFATADDGGSSNVSLRRDAEAVLSEVKRLVNVGHTSKERKNLGYPLLLMGHSRGGAIATLAAIMHLNAVVLNTKVGTDNSVIDSLVSSPTKALLILLDPVDSSDNTAVMAVETSLQSIQLHDWSHLDKRLQKSDYSETNTLSKSDQSRLCNIWPWPVLIISTPFGGSSSYYKVPYESACAPISRNGDAFAKAFISCAIDQAIPLPIGSSTSQSLSSSIINGNMEAKDADSVAVKKVPMKTFPRLLHVKLPEVGHTQLLQNRKKSTFGSVCAANEKIPDISVEGFITFLTREWVNMSIRSQDYDENQYQLEIRGIKDNTSKMFPSFKAEWNS